MNTLRRGASLCVLLLALLTTGCAQTRTVGSTAGVETTFQELNARTATRKATVQLDSGKHYSARALRLTSDSAAWFDSARGVQMSVPTSSVTRIRIARSGRGALQGLRIGVGVGASIGALISAESHEPNLVLSKGSAALIGGALFGGAGLLIGSAVGMRTGRDVYHLDAPPPLPDKPTDLPSDAPAIRRR